MVPKGKKILLFERKVIVKDIPIVTKKWGWKVTVGHKKITKGSVETVHFYRYFIWVTKVESTVQ